MHGGARCVQGAVGLDDAPLGASRRDLKARATSHSAGRCIAQTPERTLPGRGSAIIHESFISLPKCRKMSPTGSQNPRLAVVSQFAENGETGQESRPMGEMR